MQEFSWVFALDPNVHPLSALKTMACTKYFTGRGRGSGEVFGLDVQGAVLARAAIPKLQP
jgi:hypothetical protein